MRSLSRSSTIAAILTASVTISSTAAWTASDGDTQNAPRSVLAPRPLDNLPAPLPIPTASQTERPPSIASQPAPLPAEPGQGNVTAVPLPPPGAEPRVPPPLASGPTATTLPLSAPVGKTPPANVPSGNAPISLALPRVTPPPLATAPVTGIPVAPAGKSATAGTVSARLPTPALSAEAAPADFLRAARGALIAGRAGEARSALEMAQTRLLDRSVDAGKEREPSNDLAVKQISEALGALTVNDRMNCMRYIEFASQTIGSPLN